MFIWKQQKTLPPQLFLPLKETIQKERATLEGKETDSRKFFTTFFGPSPEMAKSMEPLTEFYGALVKDMMIDLGLYESSTYSWVFWVQMNNSETSTHTTHHHFRGGEIASWVHFLQVPEEERSFYFQTDRGPIFPEEQLSNTVVAFPPWRPHGVKPLKKKNFDRYIVAGNITLNTLSPINATHPFLSQSMREDGLQVTWDLSFS